LSKKSQIRPKKIAKLGKVLVISGHDPSGGAGIHADIQTLAQLGCHSCSVLTCLTVQDTVNVQAVYPVAANIVSQQLEVLSKDIYFDVIKIGLIVSLDIAQIVQKFITSTEPKPSVVIDPVLAASGGRQLTDPKLRLFIESELLPLATVATPNRAESEQLSAKKNHLATWAKQVVLGGCEQLLITAGDATGDHISHQLFNKSGQSQIQCKRLAQQYHGSGCTLAAAISAFLAQGFNAEDAIHQAHKYTYSTLQKAFPIGQGQCIPNRIDRSGL